MRPDQLLETRGIARITTIGIGEIDRSGPSAWTPDRYLEIAWHGDGCRWERGRQGAHEFQREGAARKRLSTSCITQRDAEKHHQQNLHEWPHSNPTCTIAVVRS